MRVIIHTTDWGLAKAAQFVIPKQGYHSIRIEYYPPQSVARQHQIQQTSGGECSSVFKRAIAGCGGG